MKLRPRNRRAPRVDRNARSRRVIPPRPGEWTGVRTVVQSIVPTLLHWFLQNARDLPWRRSHDPYAIWVSEIMLQQTQVKTVIPYWERWMRELPTIKSAAEASPAKLHKLWEGLGYYTRVRNLQKAARQIVAEQGGKFPENLDAVLNLPGIGRYTAGAICSIAFHQPTPILDGNVTRVLTRVFGIATDPRDKQTNAQLWQLAEELVKAASEPENSATQRTHKQFLPLPWEKAGVRVVVQDPAPNACSHLNQSLMELGALICTSRSPQCNICPVQKHCIAQKESLQDQLPNLAKRETATARRFIAFVIERDGKLLVRQRPDGVVNAHLWEFPNVEVPGSSATCRRVSGSESTQSADKLPALPTGNFHLSSTKPLCTIKHSITRYRITLEAYRAELVMPATKMSGRWLSPRQLHKLAFTSAHKKILNHL